MAPRIASVLYGVIAIMTVDLAVQPDRLRYSEAVLGVLLVGLAMAMTRLFVRVVTKEAEIGAHLPMKESATADVRRYRSPATVHEPLHLIECELAILVAVHRLEDSFVSGLELFQRDRSIAVGVHQSEYHAHHER
jgi:hypothetical protein